MSSDLGYDAGKRAGWSSIYNSDRPQDILELTEAQEGVLSQFIGFSGKDQDGEKQNQFVLVYNGTSALTLTDFAKTPIGTIIIAPKISTPTIYIHKAQTATPVVGDWYKIEGTQVS